MQLAEFVQNTKPPDRGGSTAFARLQYQDYWTLWEIMRLHEEEAAYAVLIDHYDDAAFFNSDTNPSSVEFCQVKTSTASNKTWSAKELTRPARGGASFLARQYRDALKFKSYACSIAFVSNCDFNLTLPSKETSLERDRIDLLELDPDELSDIRTRIEKQLGCPCSLGEDIACELRVSPVSIKDKDGHTLSRVFQFVEKVAPESVAHVRAIYRTLCTELFRRHGHDRVLDDWQSILRNKGLTRGDVQSILDDAASRPDRKSWAQKAEQQLQFEGVPATKVTRIGAAWRLMEMRKLDSANFEYQKAFRDARAGLERMFLKNPDRSLKECLDEITEELANPDTLTIDMIGAIICHEFYNIQDTSVRASSRGKTQTSSSATTQGEEE